jgi:hypothetical protein
VKGPRRLSARRRPILRRALPLLAAAAMALAAPVAAQADPVTHYASPSGTGAAPCTDAANPCPLNVAINPANMANGDTLLVAPGTYHESATLQTGRKITFSGEPGKAPPLIEFTAGGLLFEELSTVKDFRVRSTSGVTYGLRVDRPGSTVERVESGGDPEYACAFQGIVVRDSLCVSDKANGTGILASLGSGTPVTETPELINVTAAGGVVGLAVEGAEQASMKVRAINSIFVGTEHDILARTVSPGAFAEVALSHSSFHNTQTIGTHTAITLSSEGSNQGAPPIFIDAAAGDYTEAATSPTRLAGDLAALLPGELDLAGNPRTGGCEGVTGVDIGAYQYQCPVPSVEPPPSTPPNDGSSTDRTSASPAAAPKPPAAPTLSGLALSPKKFAVTGKGKKGTTISYTLSTAATVKLEVLAKVKRTKGRRIQFVPMGTIPATGKAGVNKVRFAGKVKGKALAPGSYVVRATATAAGLTSHSAQAGFFVLAPPA